MEKALFDDLLQSLKEAKAISKGKAKAPRRFEVAPIDVKFGKEKIEIPHDN